MVDQNVHSLVVSEFSKSVKFMFYSLVMCTLSQIQLCFGSFDKHFSLTTEFVEWISESSVFC